MRVVARGEPRRLGGSEVVVPRKARRRGILQARRDAGGEVVGVVDNGAAVVFDVRHRGDKIAHVINAVARRNSSRRRVDPWVFVDILGGGRGRSNRHAFLGCDGHHCWARLRATTRRRSLPSVFIGILRLFRRASTCDTARDWLRASVVNCRTISWTIIGKADARLSGVGRLFAEGSTGLPRAPLVLRAILRRWHSPQHTK